MFSYLFFLVIVLVAFRSNSLFGQPSRTKPTKPESAAKPLFEELPAAAYLNYKHIENPYDDFNQERLLPNRLSILGPGLATGDVNGDGLDDIFIGGAQNLAGGVFLQNADGTFRRTEQPALEFDALFEDVGALLFDADGDGDLDLYVVSGGNEIAVDDKYVQLDRMYLNDGKGNFTKIFLPEMFTSGSCVLGADYDGDGDIDLFIAGRNVPGKYPEFPRSYILRNDKGKFTDVTAEIAPELLNPGLITAALWTDFDNDNDIDLILVGDWSSVMFFRNDNGKFTDITAKTGIADVKGWWNSISAGDFDNDGDMDYVIGNLGLNSRYKATPELPIELYAKDFDANGSIDLIMTSIQKGVKYPIRMKQTMMSQMPSLNMRYQTFHAYADATFNDIFPPQILTDAVHFQANEFRSILLENLGNGTFRVKPLPTMAQLSPIFSTAVQDFDGDGNLDVLLVGNFYGPDVEIFRYDAGKGLLLRGDGKGNFTDVPILESGFYTPRDARSLSLIRAGKTNSLLAIVGNNNSEVQVFKEEVPNSKLLTFPKKEYLTHAIITMKNGQHRRQEFQYGSGYLSQSSWMIVATPTIKQIELFNGKKLIRTIKP